MVYRHQACQTEHRGCESRPRCAALRGTFSDTTTFRGQSGIFDVKKHNRRCDVFSLGGRRDRRQTIAIAGTR